MGYPLSLSLIHISSGCGKSTFLKTLNRMNDLVPGVRIEGEVLYNGPVSYTHLAMRCAGAGRNAERKISSRRPSRKAAHLASEAIPHNSRLMP